MKDTQKRSHDKNLFGGHIRLHGVLQGLSEVLKAHFSASWSRQLPGTNQDAEFIQHVTQGVFIYHKSVLDSTLLILKQQHLWKPQWIHKTGDTHHVCCLSSIGSPKNLLFSHLWRSAHSKDSIIFGWLQSTPHYRNMTIEIFHYNHSVQISRLISAECSS